MENHRRRNSSGDKFSFPIFPPIEDHDNSSSFEFGCPTDPRSPNSPADHLFYNGRLLPHSFPCQPTNTISFCRSTSITSSVSSKDSFISSRSNSTNSRSSSCSSARTSTSTESSASERKLLTQSKVSMTKSKITSDWHRVKKPVLTPHYGSSQRWQFIMPAPAPAPPLKHVQHGDSLRRRKVHLSGKQEEFMKKSKKKSKAWMGTWFGWRFFKSFVSACKECHAIKPLPKKYAAKS